MTVRGIIWMFVLAALVGLGALLGLSGRFAGVPHPYDKIGHFLGFFLSTLVLGYYFRNFILGMVLSVVAGIGIEAIQYFSSDRYFSYEDILSDSAGAVAGLIVAVAAAVLLKWHKKRSVKTDPS